MTPEQDFFGVRLQISEATRYRRMPSGSGIVALRTPVIRYPLSDKQDSPNASNCRLVHDDPEFAEPALATLRAAGDDVVAFQDSVCGIGALEHPKRIELLITRVRFPAGTPNGAALARMARLKRPGIKVLFTSFPEVRQHTDGLGEFLPRPISTDELLETVGRMLDRHD